MSLLLLLRSPASAAATRSLTVSTTPPGLNQVVTITATLLDTDGSPLVGKTIYFTVTGVNSASGSDATDVNGEATFDYTPTNVGTDTIRAQWGASNGLNLVSVDDSTSLIYRHDGFSTSILQSLNPGFNLDHITFDGDNLITADQDSTSTIRKHDGFSTTILDSFTVSGPVAGIAWDGTNLLIAYNLDDRVDRHDGFSSTVLQSLTLTGLETIHGIAWDGENLLVGNYFPLADDEVRRYVGFSNTLDTSFTHTTAYTIEGLAWDGDDLMVAADDTTTSNPDKLYLHDGFSDTVSSTIDSPSTQLRDIAWTVAMTAELSVSVAVRGSGTFGRTSGRVIP